VTAGAAAMRGPALAATRLKEPIDVAPFLAWCANRETRIRRELGSEHGIADGKQTNHRERLVTELGWTIEAGTRRLHRWTHPDQGDGFSGLVERAVIEDALHHAGVQFADVYPDLDDDDQGEQTEAYCNRCHDTVTAIDGICPWCETAVAAEKPTRMYCPREDAMSYPNLEGDCWRCGGELRADVPWIPCACGCGTMIHRFDRWGRSITYSKGHQPKNTRDSKSVDAAPFAAWLRDELHNLDPIEALARRTRVPRNELVNLLEGRTTEVELGRVRTALWTSARCGQGKGLPARPGAVTFADLYPDHCRSRTCQKCGGGKAPHAEMCKACRRKMPVVRTHKSSVTEPLLQEAKRIVDDGGHVIDAARAIQSRTRCTNPESVALELYKRFHERGWTYPRGRSGPKARLAA